MPNTSTNSSHSVQVRRYVLPVSFIVKVKTKLNLLVSNTFFFILHTASSFYDIFSQTAGSVKISNLLICFCSFEMSCPILEKDNFITNV